MLQSDLVVLGAGPAGISIALLMAEKGFSVEVFDPAYFPRPKICGEFLNPQATKWLQEQGLTSTFRELEPYPIYGMKITDQNGASFTGHYSGNEQINGYAILRKNFDTLLITEARKAGVRVNEGWTPKTLLFDGSKIIGIRGKDASGNQFESHGRVIIGADGRNNLIGRTFGWVQGIRALRKYAFQTYFKNLPGLSHFGEVHLVRDGYVGIAPLTSSLANVALVVDEKALPGAEKDPEEFLMGRIQESRLAARFEGLDPDAPIVFAGPLAFRVRRTSGHGALLVGDTCGFIDPFTGEGVNYAFISANLAATVLEDAFRTGNFSDTKLAEYDRARSAILGRKYALAELLQKAIARPALSLFLIRRFARKLELADTVVSAVGSAVPVERVWNLRFLFKVLTA